MIPFIRLSQGQLNLLEVCPPQFQQIYLEQLRSPVGLEQQEKLAWGNQFHLLMQQRELGLPVEPLLEKDEQLKHSFTALLEAAPEILRSDENTWRDAEHCRTISFGHYLLTVVYDLLIAGASQAQIIDWKTYLQPQNRNRVARDWQTRLYLYVLVETSDYLPEQVAMTYWFVRGEPQRLTFTYSSLQHEEARHDLAYLLTQLDRWLENYCSLGIAFPHDSQRHDCASCPYYNAWFTAKSAADSSHSNGYSVAEIEEISL